MSAIEQGFLISISVGGERVEKKGFTLWVRYINPGDARWERLVPN